MRFGADFGPKFSQNFLGRKILRSKSGEITPTSLPPGGAQLAYDLRGYQGLMKYVLLDPSERFIARAVVSHRSIVFTYANIR